MAQALSCSVLLTRTRFCSLASLSSACCPLSCWAPRGPDGSAPLPAPFPCLGGGRGGTVGLHLSFLSQKSGLFRKHGGCLSACPGEPGCPALGEAGEARGRGGQEDRP